MKKVKADDLRPEYKLADLGQVVRGKYLESYRRGTNLVLLSPDVAKVFPTEEAVNNALRSLIEIAQKTTELEKPRIVQTKNPKSEHYVKIDREAGRIIGQKKSDKLPYKDVPIIRKKSK